MATAEFELGQLSIGYCEMTEVIIFLTLIYIYIIITYNNNNKADKTSVIEMATNALKNQQKSDKTIYDKDIAQSIKLDLGIFLI